MDANTPSSDDLQQMLADATAGGANQLSIELDAASPLSGPAASSATLASGTLAGAQPSQPGVGPVVDLPAHHFVSESGARKGEGAREKSTSKVWDVVFRLDEPYFTENSLEMGGKNVETHVCRALLVDAKTGEATGAFCNARLLLSRQKVEGKGDKLGPFITTKAINHCSQKHESTEAAANFAAMAKTLAYKRQNMLLAGGGQAGASSSPLLMQGKLERMVLNPGQKALCAQVHFFIYCRQSISKSTLLDPTFRALMRCNDKPGEPTPVLSFKMIEQWVAAEFEIFLRFLRHAMALKHEQAKGNPFAQGQHDAGTLKNHKKVQVQAVQWVDPSFGRNQVVAFALSSLAAIEDDSEQTDEEHDCEGRSLASPPPMLIPAHTDANVAKDYTLNFEKATGLKLKNSVATAIQDGGACGVASRLALRLREREICNMHAASKIGAAALGFLVRTRLKKAIDPFPAGKQLCARVLGVAKAFSWSKQRDGLARTAATLANVSTARMPPRAMRVCLRGSAHLFACTRGLTLSPLPPPLSRLPRPRSRPSSRSKFH